MKITLLKSYSDPNPVGYTTFGSLIKKLLKDPSKLEEADKLMSATGEEYDKLKAKLPAFIIGEFSRRNETGLTHFEPFFCFDIDHVPAERVDEIFEKLSGWDHTYVLYPSPSGRGFRLFVRSNCTEDTRGIAYHIASNNLSIFSGIPLEEDLTPEQRKTDLVINTSTKDISRLWFYTGIRKFFHNKDHRPVIVPTQVANRTARPQMDEDEKVEALVAEIERTGTDITADYDSWLRAGMAIASTFGDGGRGYFHRISGYNSGYDYGKADRKYDNLVKSSRGKISIATLFKLAKDCGVTVSYRPAHEAMYPSATWDDPGAERMVNAFCASGPDNYMDLIARVPYLKPACFKDEVQKAVFEVIESMASQGKYIDPITVSERVESFSPETRADTKLKIHLEAAMGYADTVFSFYRKSEAARILLEKSNEIAGGKDVTQVLSAMEGQMSSIGMEEAEDDSIAAAVKRSRKNRNELFIRMVNDESTLIGSTTGLEKEDEFTGGRIPGTLAIIAARPGMGKTSKILNEALAAAKSGTGVGIVSLEMTKGELTKRLTAIESGIDNEKLKNPLLLDLEAGDDMTVERAEDAIANLPIRVVDKVFSIRGIRAKIRQWAQQGAKTVYIDYLGLIQSEGKDNENLRLQKITGELKRLAKELDICIVLLSQLSRAVETRGGTKRPILSDLRDSGAIEQDADIVAFLYRPEYYQIMHDEDGYSTEGMIELIYAKHRDGETGTVIAGCDLKKFKFMPFTRKLKPPIAPIAPSPWLDGDEGDESDIF